MNNTRTHLKILFECEKHAPVMPVGSSGDKAYLKIRREAKLMTGTLDMLCSRKGILR
ncbi:MAG TPA: hypothetical protein VLG37_04915 [Candidatus Saccharimonadales bacterium]|nr:hypothetical protein [Candidatus Saccharimonadales bacterium]